MSWTIKTTSIRPAAAALALAIMLGALATGAATVYRADQRRLARIDQQDSEQIKLLGGQIRQLRAGPRQAAEGQLSASVLNAICEQAARKARLPKKALVEVNPFPPQRVGRTDYKELATKVYLETVSAKQLAAFVFAVQQQAAAMVAKELEMSPSRSDPDSWDASITFAALVYTPMNSDQEKL